MSIEKLQKFLLLVTEKMGMRFSFKGDPISSEDVFSDEGLLPGLCCRADSIFNLCTGEDLGFVIEQSETSLLGKSVDISSGSEIGNSLRLFFLVDVLIEIKKSNADRDYVVLDELMYDE